MDNLNSKKFIVVLYVITTTTALALFSKITGEQAVAVNVPLGTAYLAINAFESTRGAERNGKT